MFYRRRKNWCLREVEVCPHTLQVRESFGEDGTEQIKIFLREHMSYINVSLTFMPHRKLQRPTPAFVLWFQAPGLFNRIVSLSVVLEKSQLGNVQRVVAHPMFHSTKVPTQDDIMICSAEEKNENTSFQAVTAWFAKSFCVFHNCIEKGDLSIEEDDVSLDMSNGSSHVQTELYFVPSYEIFGTNILAIDAVDNALGCIGLRWHRENAEERRYSASKFFGIVPVEGILRHIPLVPADGTRTLLDSKDLQRREFDRLQNEGPTFQVMYST